MLLWILRFIFFFPSGACGTAVFKLELFVMGFGGLVILIKHWVLVLNASLLP
jgi:hypothetical protein